MSKPNPSRQPSFQSERSPQDKGKQRVAQTGEGSQTPIFILDEPLAPEDDWSNVEDPLERRKIQNRLAQRKLREKSRLQKEASARDSQNRKHAAAAYTTLDPDDVSMIDDDTATATLSGAPWGTFPMTMTPRRVSSTRTHSSRGKSRASSQASTGRAGPSNEAQMLYQQQQQHQRQRQNSSSREGSYPSTTEPEATSARGRPGWHSARDSSNVGSRSMPTIRLSDAGVTVRPVDDVLQPRGPGLGVGNIGRHSVGLGLSQQFAWRGRTPQRRAEELPWGLPVAKATAAVSTTPPASLPQSTGSFSQAVPSSAVISANSPRASGSMGFTVPGALHRQPDSAERGLGRELYTWYVPTPTAAPTPSPWPESGTRRQWPHHQQQHHQQHQRRPPQIPVTWYDNWGQLRADESDSPTPRVRTFTAGSGAGPFGEMRG